MMQRICKPVQKEEVDTLEDKPLDCQPQQQLASADASQNQQFLGL
jgi:hypothetical protein